MDHNTKPFRILSRNPACCAIRSGDEQIHPSVNNRILDVRVYAGKGGGRSAVCPSEFVIFTCHSLLRPCFEPLVECLHAKLHSNFSVTYLMAYFHCTISSCRRACFLRTRHYFPILLLPPVYAVSESLGYLRGIHNPATPDVK